MRGASLRVERLDVIVSRLFDQPEGYGGGDASKCQRKVGAIGDDEKVKARKQSQPCGHVAKL